MQTTPESASTRPTSVSASIANDQASSSSSIANGPESSASSVPIPTQLEAPPLKAFKKKRRSQPRKTGHSSEGQINRYIRALNGHYWNEFDDDEERADEPYTILIDPNESMPYLGKETISRMIQAVKGWFRLSEPEYTDPERQRLVPEQECFSKQPRSFLSASSSSSSLSALAPRCADRYFTFPSSSHPKSDVHPPRTIRDRDVLLLCYCAAAFVASSLLLLIAGLIAFNRSSKVAYATDMGACVMLVASILFAVLGTALFFLRRQRRWEDVRWFQIGVVVALWPILGYGWLVVFVRAIP